MNKRYFLDQFESQIRVNKKAKPGNSGYGDNVIPMIDLYKNLTSPQECQEYREAIESLLTDTDSEKRHFGVLLCLGFIVFCDI